MSLKGKPSLAVLQEKIGEALEASSHLSEETRQTLLDILAKLEGELQARDLALCALKSQCLKYVLTHITSNQNYLHDPLFALQRDEIPNGASEGPRSDDSFHVWLHPNQSIDVKLASLEKLSGKQKVAIRKLAGVLRHLESQKKRLEEDLNELQERHLGLAEVSQAPNPSADPSSCEALESSDEPRPVVNSEDASKVSEDPVAISSSTEELKQTLEEQKEEIESLQNQLKEEREQKMQMILLLVNDRKKIATLYLEEKRRSDELALILREERKKVKVMAKELEEESQRSLALDQEVEQYIREIKSQREESKLLIKDESRKSAELEEALRRSRQECDHLRKQLAEAHRVAMSQASVSLPPPPPPIPTPQVVAPSNANLSYGSISGMVLDNTYISSQEVYVPAVSKMSTTIKMNPKSKEDSGKLDNSDNGFLMKGRSTRTKVLSDQSPFAPSGSGLNTVVKKTSLLTSSKGVGGNIPPPIPPNKPALNLYKGSLVGGGGMGHYSSVKTVTTSSTDGGGAQK